MGPPAADNSWVADFDSFESSEAAPPAAEAQVKQAVNTEGGQGFEDDQWGDFEG